MAITYPIPVSIVLTGQINNKASYDDPDNWVEVTVTGSGTIRSEGSYQDFQFTSNVPLDNFDFNILQTQVLGGCCIICAVEEQNGKNLVSMGANAVSMYVKDTFSNKFVLSTNTSCSIANPLNLNGTIAGGTGAPTAESKPTMQGTIVLTPNTAGTILTGVGTITANYNIGGAKSFSINSTHTLTFGDDPDPLTAAETRTVSATGTSFTDGTSCDIVSSVTG